LIFESREGFRQRTDPQTAPAYWSGVAHYLEALREAGIFVGGAGLEPPETARSVVIEEGRHVVQDGPYAEVKEQLGGLFLIQVAGMTEALEWARRFPVRPGQIVEVRPTLRDDQSTGT
jgi:hypothetical protein